MVVYSPHSTPPPCFVCTLNALEIYCLMRWWQVLYSPYAVCIHAVHANTQRRSKSENFICIKRMVISLFKWSYSERSNIQLNYFNIFFQHILNWHYMFLKMTKKHFQSSVVIVYMVMYYSICVYHITKWITSGLKSLTKLTNQVELRFSISEQYICSRI